MTSIAEKVRVEKAHPMDYAPLDFDPEPSPCDLLWPAEASPDSARTPTLHRSASAASAGTADIHPSRHQRIAWMAAAIRRLFRIGSSGRGRSTP